MKRNERKKKRLVLKSAQALTRRNRKTASHFPPGRGSNPGSLDLNSDVLPVPLSYIAPSQLFFLPVFDFLTRISLDSATPLPLDGLAALSTFTLPGAARPDGGWLFLAIVQDSSSAVNRTRIPSVKKFTYRIHVHLITLYNLLRNRTVGSLSTKHAFCQRKSSHSMIVYICTFDHNLPETECSVRLTLTNSHEPKTTAKSNSTHSVLIILIILIIIIIIIISPV